MVIGDVESISEVRDELIVKVDLGAGASLTAVFGQKTGCVDYPVIGDRVLLVDIGNQWVVDTVFRSFGDLKTGEKLIFCRDANGDIQGQIRMTQDGKVDINNGNLVVLK